MTLDDIKTFTTGTVGMTDATTAAQAEMFIKNRWRMLWNVANWRQARVQDTVSVSQGVQDVTLPATFDLVTAVRLAGQGELTGLHDAANFHADPNGYDQIGSPMTFSPLPKTAGGLSVIRLGRVPSAAGTLLVIGKTKCPELDSGSASPLITGADQVLCEYVIGDLYRWIRQFGKAAACYQNAQILTQTMLDLETKQSAEICRIIPMEQQLGSEFGFNW